MHVQGDAGSGYGGQGTGDAAAGGQPGGSYEFGVDPNLDPELAMALRVSLEEERARQTAAGSAGPSDAAPAGGTPLSVHSWLTLHARQAAAGTAGPLDAAPADEAPCWCMPGRASIL